jgi:HAE1 family hydrophobic/amphiphilic exporter-1
MEFMPNVDRGEITVSVETDPGNKIEQTNQTVQQIEGILAKMPEVAKVVSSVGSAGQGMIASFANNRAELTVTLIDKNKRKLNTDEVSQLIKKNTMDIPGIKLSATPVSMMGAGQAPLQLLVTGSSYEDVQKGADVVLNIVRKVEGTSDVRFASEEGKPELKVEIDREKLANLGLTLADIGNNLRIALTGDEDSKFRDPHDLSEYIMRVQLDQYDRSQIGTVEDISFQNNKGQMIQLKQFAKVSQDLGPTRLERYNRITSKMIQSQVFGKSSGSVANEILAKIKQNQSKLPAGVGYEFIGQQKIMMSSMISLLYALFAGILFVYMIMVALYNSYAYPFVVLFSIPVAIVGALYGLAVTGKSMSIYSMLGIIMLIGLVAKNAILLVDRANQMKAEKGMSTYEALLEAGQTRLRPILMTTFAMVIGMLPIALSTAAGSEAKSGLAVVLIGGLTSSLLLTLVLVPVVYQKFDKWGDKIRHMRAKSKKKQRELAVEESM